MVGPAVPRIPRFSERPVGSCRYRPPTQSGQVVADYRPGIGPEFHLEVFYDFFPASREEQRNEARGLARHCSPFVSAFWGRQGFGLESDFV